MQQTLFISSLELALLTRIHSPNLDSTQVAFQGTEALALACWLDFFFPWEIIVLKRYAYKLVY